MKLKNRIGPRKSSSGKSLLKGPLVEKQPKMNGSKKNGYHYVIFFIRLHRKSELLGILSLLALLSFQIA